MRASGQRGSASIELAIVTLPVLLCTVAIIAAGRLTLAYQRTASLARTKAEAQTAAYEAALASFRSQGIACNTLNVTVNTTGFDIPVGQPAAVSVSVECAATLGDIALPGSGMPGSVTLSSSFVSPLDLYRSRS
jgi:Flp pilus assembly protein TadG